MVSMIADVVLACAHACLERTIQSVESRILEAQRRPGAWSNVAFLSFAREKVARRVRKWQLFSRSRARALTDATTGWNDKSIFYRVITSGGFSVH
jgi:hypothetical protein